MTDKNRLQSESPRAIRKQHRIDTINKMQKERKTAKEIAEALGMGYQAFASFKNREGI